MYIQIVYTQTVYMVNSTNRLTLGVFHNFDSFTSKGNVITLFLALSLFLAHVKVISSIQCCNEAKYLCFWCFFFSKCHWFLCNLPVIANKNSGWGIYDNISIQFFSIFISVVIDKNTTGKKNLLRQFFTKLFRAKVGRWKWEKYR